MDRRNFIRLASTGAAVGIIAPSVSADAVTASNGALANSSSLAGGLYYTKDAPGRWGQKTAAGHVPLAEVSKGNNGVSLKVTTPHEMKGYAHYIAKHILLDENFKFIDEYMFNPEKDKAAISTFALGNYKGLINVLSVCNKHDTWLSVVKV